MRQHTHFDIKLMTISLLYWPPPNCWILFHFQGVSLERSKNPINTRGVAIYNFLKSDRSNLTVLKERHHYESNLV